MLLFLGLEYVDTNRGVIEKLIGVTVVGWKEKTMGVYVKRSCPKCGTVLEGYERN